MRNFVLFILPVFLVIACKEEAKDKAVDFKEVCSGKYWAKEEKGSSVGERIAFSGYFKFSTGLQTDTILLDLFETAERKGKFIMVSVRVHGAKNGIDELPKEVKQSDLKFHLNSGETVGVDDRITVHAEHINNPGDAPTCLFKAFVLERG